jgi:hypothetical protein
MKGSEHNDLHIRMELQNLPAVFRVESAMVWTFFSVLLKPVAIMQKQESLR